MGKNIKLWFDEKEDILYLSFAEGEAVDSEEVAENVRIEYDEKGMMIGVEIFNISKMLASSIAEKLRELVLSKETS
ncbi:MAG: DUF2283 domain-containing protein [Candidatus Altiarchaeota archaeon]